MNNKKKLKIFFAVGILISIAIWISNTTWQLPTLYYEDPIERGTYTVGKMGLSSEWSREFELNPAISQNIETRLMAGAVVGEIQIKDGNDDWFTITNVNFRANPRESEVIDIGGIVKAMKFRIPNPELYPDPLQKQLIWCKYLGTTPPKTWPVKASEKRVEY